MFEIKGKYGIAKVFASIIDEVTTGQIIKMLNVRMVEGAQVAIMPDTHAGKGSVIGFVMRGATRMSPFTVGVDINCGMRVIPLGKVKIDLAEFDAVVRAVVPMGFNMHNNSPHIFPLGETMVCWPHIRTSRVRNSIGTLGGGNHFIELNKDEEDNIYLVIHSGSRNLGVEVANYYQKKAVKAHSGDSEYMALRNRKVEELKARGLHKKIKKTLDSLDAAHKEAHPTIPEELCWLEGEALNEYLYDMEIVAEYANLNRWAMGQAIVRTYFGAHLSDFDSWETVHNYYNGDDKTIRKGAISAHKGERVIIPINMKEGSILAIGKGNEESLNSAPHGAGRLHSRGAAKRLFNLEDYAAEMKDAGIYTTSVSQETLDECPSAYKPMADIIENIKDMVDIVGIIRPIYNCKAGGD